MIATHREHYMISRNKHLLLEWSGICWVICHTHYRQLAEKSVWRLCSLNAYTQTFIEKTEYDWKIETVSFYVDSIKCIEPYLLLLSFSCLGVSLMNTNESSLYSVLYSSRVKHHAQMPPPFAHLPRSETQMRNKGFITGLSLTITY